MPALATMKVAHTAAAAMTGTHHDRTPRAAAIAVSNPAPSASTPPSAQEPAMNGSGACNPVVAPVQELASREAIKRCGGPADCLVLYVGDKKAANIEIVSR